MGAVRSFFKQSACALYHTGIFHPVLKIATNGKKNYPGLIINYHSFVDDLAQAMDTMSSVTHRIDDFRREVRFLKKYFHIVPLDEFVAALRSNHKFSVPTVAITVDDGYKNNYDLLFPVLKEEAVPATIFLTTDYINSTEEIWVNRLAHVFYATQRTAFNGIADLGVATLPLASLDMKREAYSQTVGKLKDIPTVERKRYTSVLENELGQTTKNERTMLNWDEVREMAKHGIAFGAHSCSHPILSQLPIEEAKQEILRSKQAIEENLGRPVKHFAFPNGRPQDFNEALRQYCQEIGFESVATCDYGVNETVEDAYRLKRIGPSVPMGLFALNVLRALRTERKTTV